MRWLAVSLALLLLAAPAPAQETTTVPMADGFEVPVGRDGLKQYYKARGFRPNGHLGEDWNGAGGGDSDLGDPVYCTANGLVVFARNYRVGWGNVVIVRHAYLENGKTLFVDSLYGHLNEILVQEGEILPRGKKLGTIGNNRGMYDAHLHFEIRKNIHVGMFRSSFSRNFDTYWDPTQFIAAHRNLGGAGTSAAIPINTFPTNAPPTVEDSSPLAPTAFRPVSRSGPFKVDRFSDMRK
jgi:murein DD-endopeptidase MepM/ murein hydrolase activator NlpD